MTATDVVLIAALAVFVVAWWVRSLPKRPMILGIAAGVAFIAGCAGVWLYRWQDGLGAVIALILLNVLGANALRQAKPQPGLPYVSGSLFVIFTALAIALIVEFPVNALPKPSGPYAVGVRSFELDDARRPGVLAAKPNEPRRLLVRVWYPAGDVSGLKPRPYFTPQEARTTGRSVGELFKFSPFFTYLRHVRTNSYEDAPLRAGSAHLPVIFYSHGYTSFLSQNTVLMENLASHGYVVFSVQHTYDSTATLFPNGDVAPADPDIIKQLTAAPGAKGPKPEMAAMFGSTLDQRLEGQLLMREQALANKSRLARSGGIWLADQEFVHDTLQAGAVPDAIKPIASASDFSRVGIVGMSFGGAMAGDICVTDHRCAAGVNLDGSDFPFQAFDRAMPVPFLMFHSDVGNLYRIEKAPPVTPHSYNEFSYEPFATAGADPNVTRVWLKGAQHVGLSDFSLFMRRPIRDPLLGTAPSKVLIGAQYDFVLGFFDRYLRGRQNGFPQPQLNAYAGWEAPLPNAEISAWWTKKTPAERAAIEARIERDRPGLEQMPAALGAR